MSFNSATSFRQRGFVLPYVLIVIFILALAGSIAAVRLQSTTRILTSIQASEVTSRMMDNAENVAIFALMAGNAVQGGYDLNPNSLVQSEFGLTNAFGLPVNSGHADKLVPDLWEASGGLRKVKSLEGDVIISLQDVSGLPSLNTPLHVSFDSILKLAATTTRGSKQLRQALADYIDPGNDRRAQGAEAADYKLRNMPPPSNSPLRSYAELSSVLGWDQVLNRINMRVLKERTTLQTKAGYRSVFAKKRQYPQSSFNESSLLSNSFDPLFDGAVARSTVPTGHMRLTFWAQRQMGPDAGLWDKRIIEVSRQAQHISIPYTRHWVMEMTVLEEEVEFNAEQLDEIEYVINSAFVRP